LTLEFGLDREIRPQITNSKSPFHMQNPLSRNTMLQSRATKAMMESIMVTHKEMSADFVILGGGIAGMRAAIDLARGGRVLVLTKDDLYESSTEYAQGGIAAAVGEDDEVRLHLHDTLLAGDGLCREEAVRVLVEEGPEQIHQLIDWGMHFDRNGTKLAFTREGAHSRSRVLHAHGDSTGSEILRALMAKARSISSIQLLPHAFATDLVVEGNTVSGVTYLDTNSASLKRISASAVLLATGGLGHVYKETTNPSVACGDGVAMAYRAGGLLSDMEFVQFHPTALFVKGAPRFLLSEALRGEGAHLRNLLLERFMPRYHEAAELAPRDVVARAIILEMQRTRAEFVYLDMTALDPEHVKKRFPRIYSTCLKYNIDITADLVPIRPAAHYAMGGVATDLHGATSLNGLFAAGEVASTGVHGANRLASNSLLEGLVFGARSAAGMLNKHVAAPFPCPPAKVHGGKFASLASSQPPSPPTDAKTAVEQAQGIMWSKVAILRDGKLLCEAVKRLSDLHLPETEHASRQDNEVGNILTVARLIARCALAREESRGAHYRSDFPLQNETKPPQHSYVSKNSPVFFE
jgi:L-aspartate oxidase